MTYRKSSAAALPVKVLIFAVMVSIAALSA